MHRRGARLTEIAGILGHSDLPTLQRYLDLQAADFADAHSRYGPVDHLDL
jgi:site-specific recombinase XerD